jgi:hypothetical protein
MQMKLKTNGQIKKTDYWVYKRPLADYINTGVSYGLLVSGILEPPSAIKLKGKIRKSPIPAYAIVRAVKV